MKNKKTKKLFMFSFAILFLLFFLGLISWWYWQNFIMPNRIINYMQSKMRDVYSVHAYGDTNIFGKIGDSGVDLKISYDGFFNKKKKSLSTNFKINGFYELLPVKTDLDIIMLEDKSYFKINSLPEIIKFYGNMSEAENRWAVIDSAYKDLEIIGIFNEDDFFENVKIEGSEKIDNRNMYKIKAEVSSSKISEFFDLKEMLNIFTQEEISKIKESLLPPEDIIFNLWICKNDYYLYKADGKFSFVIDEDNLDVEILIMMNKFNEGNNITEQHPRFMRKLKKCLKLLSIKNYV